MPDISIVKTRGNLKEEVKQAFSLIGGFDIKEGDVVLIKPNLVIAPKNENDFIAITNLNLIKEVAVLCSEKGAKEIYIGDGCGDFPSDEVFKSSGLAELVNSLKEQGHPVGLIDLNYDLNPKTKEYDVYSLEDSFNSNQKYRLSHTVFNVNVFISVPKLKVHGTCGITASLKNLIGIAPGGYYGIPKWKGKTEKLPHGVLGNPENDVLWRTILDINRIFLKNFKGKYYILVDGISACGGNYDTCVSMGLLIAGTNPAEVDYVCAKLMDYNPLKIKYIKKAAENKIGDIDNITLKGEKIEDVKKFVPPHENWISILTENQKISFNMRMLLLKKKIKRNFLNFMHENKTGMKISSALRKLKLYHILKKYFHKVL